MSKEIFVNKHDKTANLGSITKNSAKKYIAKGLVTFMLFSGALAESPKVEAKEPDSTNTTIEMLEDENTIINVPKIYKEKIFNNKENITIKDLENIEDITFEMVDDSSLEWLNYCTNLKSLGIYYESEKKPNFSDIKELKKLKMFSLMGFGAQAEFTKEDFNFLRNCDEDISIFLQETSIAPGALDDIKAKSLYLYYCDDYGIDFSKLNNVEYVGINDNTYDIATYFTTEDYDTLVKSGVTVNIPAEIEEEYFSINARLDEIVEVLGVTKEDNDIDKLNAILCYVTENLEYDEEKSKDEIEDFYLNGRLYGALEKDSSICGNYAALVDALAARIDLDTKLLTSSNHIWNLVNIDGEDYYVDAALLDANLEKQKNTSLKKEIDSGTIDDYEWYIESPINYPKESHDDHIANNLPSFFKINPYIETEEIKETTPVEIELQTKEGQRKWVLPAGAAIGIMSAIGGAIAVKKYNKNKTRNQMFQTVINENLTDDDFFENHNKSERKNVK